LRFKSLVTLLALLLTVSCGKGDGVGWLMAGTGECYGYGDAGSSDYILPYSVGTSIYLSQGNCSAFTHNGVDSYAYDFAMPLNTPVIASRGGKVVNVIDGNANGNGGTQANGVVVDHLDGTYAVYGHLSPGVTAVLSATIIQGAAIGNSGNSGYSTGPHLHFHVINASNDTLPVNFSNASPLDLTLQTGVTYTAVP
jgi:murein DD-endopeptidase MepM/ murein hydrolase activator NlpD